MQMCIVVEAAVVFAGVLGVAQEDTLGLGCPPQLKLVEGQGLDLLRSDSHRRCYLLTSHSLGAGRKELQPKFQPETMNRNFSPKP